MLSYGSTSLASSESSPLRMRFWSTLILVGLWTAKLGVKAQVIAPSCNPSTNYQWSYNSLNQDPCVVATYLGDVCSSGYGITSINATESYSGPTQAQTTPCQCSSVMYILLSACGACQGGAFTSWSTYNQNCTNVYPTIYPENIPAGTRVPKWAYQNVTAEDTFSPTEAQAVGDAPESTGILPATGSSTGTSTPTASATAGPGKKSDAGAIAGGVIGGVIVLCLAVIAILYLRRRQRRQRTRQVDMTIDDQPRPYPMATSNLTLTSTGTGFHASIPTTTNRDPPKLYNPADPSTFPPSILSMSPDLPTSPSPPLRTGSGHSPQSSETGTTGYFSGYHTVRPNTRQPNIPEV